VTIDQRQRTHATLGRGFTKRSLSRDKDGKIAVTVNPLQDGRESRRWRDGGRTLGPSFFRVSPEIRCAVKLIESKGQLSAEIIEIRNVGANIRGTRPLPIPGLAFHSGCLSRDLSRDLNIFEDFPTKRHHIFVDAISERGGIASRTDGTGSSTRAF